MNCPSGRRGRGGVMIKKHLKYPPFIVSAVLLIASLALFVVSLHLKSSTVVVATNSDEYEIEDLSEWVGLDSLKLFEERGVICWGMLRDDFTVINDARTAREYAHVIFSSIDENYNRYSQPLGVKYDENEGIWLVFATSGPYGVMWRSPTVFFRASNAEIIGLWIIPTEEGALGKATVARKTTSMRGYTVFIGYFFIVASNNGGVT
jgi:hypothetical protein